MSRHNPEGDTSTADVQTIDTIVVNVNDVLDTIQRNNEEYKDDKRSQILRITPPFDKEVKAEIHIDTGGNYPPEMTPKPIHLSPAELFEGGVTLPESVTYPNLHTEKSRFRDQHGAREDDGSTRPLTDDDQEKWNEWWETTMEQWEMQARWVMEDDQDITLGDRYPNSPTTTVTVRFVDEGSNDPQC